MSQSAECINYFWVRVFDYQYKELGEKDISTITEWGRADDGRGTLLDEYYLCGDGLTRNDCKSQVKERFKIDKFAKPRKSNGIYAIVMDSNKFFYDRFYKEIDTYCFECGKHIHGKECEFPKTHPRYYDENYTEFDGLFYYCSDDCKYKSAQKLRGAEGEFQNREGYETNGGVFGYVYHIYNRVTDMHYIGQTRYMPFFRWQEHAKQNIKGDLCDLVFNTVCEITVKSQEYLNNIEAWWIQKYIDDYGKDNVMNLTNPKLSVPYLIEQYEAIHGANSLFEVAVDRADGN